MKVVPIVRKYRFTIRCRKALKGLIVTALVSTSANLYAQVSSGPGSWGSVIPMPAIPVSAANLPDGRLLTWSAYNLSTFEPGDQDFGRTYTSIFDPVTERSDLTLVRNTQHDMFCPGTNVLADGRILVNGGSSAGRTSIFDSNTNNWSQVESMNIPRAYQGNTMLSDGSILTLGGSWDDEAGCRDVDENCEDKTAEVWTEGSGYRVLSGIPAAPLRTNDRAGQYRSDNHMWLFSVEGGDVLHAGPSKKMHMLSTDGNGNTRSVGNRADDGDSMNGNAIMYDIGKVLTIGGAANYDNETAKKSAFIIDVNNGNVSSRRVSDMNFPRVFHNSVVLPNGEVIVIGGQDYALPFSDVGSNLAAELWNPETETFRVLSAMAVPRNYHSVALLLPDGRVLAGGGGLCGNCDTNHPDVEIFTPPYLLNSDGSPANRPQIVSAPSNLAYGEQTTVRTDRAISSIVLMRSASVTHSVNNSQRRIPLSFTSSGNNNYTIQIPSDPGIAIPGNYMMFVLDQNGVPSDSSLVNIPAFRTAPPPSADTVQAENQSWKQATVDSNHANYSGNGFVNTENANGTWFDLSYNAANAGSYDVSVRYALGSSDRPQKIQVNGSDAIASFNMPSTGGWSNWQEKTFTVNLRAGSNTIRLVSLTSGGAANLDSFNFTYTGTTPPTPPPPTPPPAEEFAPINWPPQGYVISEGDSLYFSAGDTNYVEWQVTAGTNINGQGVYDSGVKNFYFDPWEAVMGPLPSGETIYVKVKQRVLGGAWASYDTFYVTEGAPPPPTPPPSANFAPINWPPEGYTISEGDSLYFSAGDTDFVEWQVTAGTDTNAQGVYDSGVKNFFFDPWAAVMGPLPSGSTLYFNVKQRVLGGAWASYDTFYITDGAQPPPTPQPPQGRANISWPPAGNIVANGTEVYFDPGDSDATQWRITLGSDSSGQGLYDSGEKSFDLDPWVVTLSSVPANALPVTLRFWQRQPGGLWSTFDTVYQTRNDGPAPPPSTPPPPPAVPAEISWPTVGTLLSNGSVVYFGPAQSQADEWRITVGADSSGQGLYDSGVNSFLFDPWETTLSGLPANSTVYLRFWQRSNGGEWASFNTVYQTE